MGVNKDSLWIELDIDTFNFILRYENPYLIQVKCSFLIPEKKLF